MRCVLGLFVVLVLVSPVWAAQDTVTSAYPPQGPAVSTPVPSIQPSGAGVVTSPTPTTVYQTPGTTPGTTVPAPAPTTGRYVVGAPPGTTPSTAPYYYYGNPPRQGWFRSAAPTYTYPSMNAGTPYVSTGQTYYAPARRRWPFGLFQRRYRQVAAPTYTTTAYNYTNSGYYGSPAVTPMYAPTTYAAPTSTVPGTATSRATPAPAGTTYTPTMYNVPTTTAPAGSAPAVTAPARTVPSQIPPPPVIP